MIVAGGSFLSAFFAANQNKVTNQDVLWGGSLSLLGAMASVYGTGDLQMVGIGLLGGGSSYLGMRLTKQVKGT